MSTRLKQSKKGSINKKRISYKTYGKRVRIIAASTALASILSTVMIERMADTLGDTINHSYSSRAISQLVTEGEERDSLLAKYSYRVDKDGHFAYDFRNIAEELIKCDPDFFDLAIYSIYSNMQYRSANLDNFFFDLHLAVESVKDENPELYYKMKDVKTFDDYLRKLRLLDSDGNPSLEKYQKYGDLLIELQKSALNNEVKEVKESEKRISGKRN